MASPTTTAPADPGGDSRRSSSMRLLGIYTGEGAKVAWSAALFAVSQANQGLGINAADTLFFLRFGVEFLPTMILISGAVVMVAILAYAAGLSRMGAGRWLPIAFMAPAVGLVLERLGIMLDLPGIYPIVWLMGQVVMTVSLTAMWTAAGEVYTTRQAKRLFPLLASAGIAGGVVGNAATGPLARLLGTDNLLIVQAGLLVTAAALAATLATRFFPAVTSPGSVSMPADLRAGLELTMRSPMLRIVAGVGVAFGALLFLVVFPFSEVVTASFPTEADVASYLGYFSAVAVAATFMVSMLATNRLFARLGIVATLMAVPIVYFGGFAVWLGSFGLVSATAVRGLQFVAVNGIGGTAWSSLFNVLTTRRRGQVMAFMTAGPMQLGTMISGGLLLTAGAFPRQVQFGIGLVMALVTGLLVWRMRGAYGSALLEAVRTGLVDVFAPPATGLQRPALDADTVRAMSVCLNDPRPEARVMAVASLGRLDEGGAAGLLSDALRDEDVRVRLAALEALDEESRQQHATELLADPAPQVRRRVLEMMWADPSMLRPDLNVVLGDPDASVRAMAAVVHDGTRGQEVVGTLLASESATDIIAALGALERRSSLAQTDLTRFLAHPHRRVRAAVAPALVARPGHAVHVGELLDDSSVTTRRSAAKALAMSDEGGGALTTVLAEGSVRATDAALGGLMAAGRGGAEFAAWARQELARAAYLRRHRQALGSHPHPSVAAEYLVRLLAAREERLERWAIMALTTPETDSAMRTVMRGLWSEDVETRAQAMEALDSIGERTVVGDLLRLLDADGEMTMGDVRSSLRELAGDHDRWIRALAFRCLREEMAEDARRLTEAAARDPSSLVRDSLSRWEQPIMQEAQTLALMDRVLVLQRVPLFSAIDPEDLERIAQVTTERHYEGDELVFREGDEGREMLFIVTGEVVVAHRVDGAIVPVRSYGPGDHVGELALLRGRPRSSDVTAGPDGVHSLVLAGPEFQAILEERPEVAMAMLGTLAERLATM